MLIWQEISLISPTGSQLQQFDMFLIKYSFKIFGKMSPTICIVSLRLYDSESSAATDNSPWKINKHVFFASIHSKIAHSIRILQDNR